jgi:Ca2+-binding EF-hand superfamily protein
LKINRDLVFKAKGNVEALFNASDFDGNGYIEFEEFLTILNCIEPDRLTLSEA